MGVMPGPRARLAAAIAVVALAVLRVVFHERLGPVVDSVFLALLAIALVLGSCRSIGWNR
jgi:hypothetical protein